MTVAGPPTGRPAAAGRSRRLPLAAITTLLVTLPFLLLLSDIVRGTLGVNPVEAGIRRTGWWALTLLVATLAVTPVRRITGWNRIIEIRKTLGLASFGYACVHLVGYVAIDQWFGWSYILDDILERPFITAGFTAFLLLLPLALTSSRAAIRRMGGNRWRQLHRLIYPAAILAVLHYFWLVKADTRPPLIYAGIVGVLLLFRVYNPFVRKKKGRPATTVRGRVTPGLSPVHWRPSTSAAGPDVEPTSRPTEST